MFDSIRTCASNLSHGVIQGLMDLLWQQLLLLLKSAASVDLPDLDTEAGTQLAQTAADTGQGSTQTVTDYTPSYNSLYPSHCSFLVP